MTATSHQIFQVFTAFQKIGILSYIRLFSLMFAPALVISCYEIEEIVQNLQLSE
jgi:hypothetical protein